MGQPSQPSACFLSPPLRRRCAIAIRIPKTKKPPAGNMNIVIGTYTLPGSTCMPKRHPVPTSSRIMPITSMAAGKSHSHSEPVKRRSQNAVFGSKHFGSAQYDAVYDYKRQEYTERLIYLRRICLYKHLNYSDKACYDGYERRDTNGIGYHPAQKRNGNVGAQQHKRCSHAHAYRVWKRSWSRQAWDKCRARDKARGFP